MDEPSPLEALHTAVQDFATSTSDKPVIVSSALVVWEQVRYDDEGTVLRELVYSVPGDGASLAGSLGLAAAADQLLRRDCIKPRADLDEDD